jgi:hypothetical protein
MGPASATPAAPAAGEDASKLSHVQQVQNELGE